MGSCWKRTKNWGDSQSKQAIVDAAIPPSDPLEPAIARPNEPYSLLYKGVPSGETLNL